MNNWAKIFIYICVFSLVFFEIQAKSINIPYNPDEISWFFHTSFFNSFFLKRNFERNMWESYEGFDHPQLSKYIFGGYLYLKDNKFMNDRDLLEEKYSRWDYFTSFNQSMIKDTAFQKYISYMRQVNIMLTFFTLVILFFVLILLSENWLISLVFPLMITQNEFFLNIMIRATSDSHYVFFMMVSLLLFFTYLKEKNSKWLIFYAILSGLALSAKLTGVFILFAYIIFIGIDLISKRNIIEESKNLLIVFIFCFFSWYIINPTLYYSPFYNTLKYFSFRMNHSAELQRYAPQEALTNLGARINAVSCTLFIPPCHSMFDSGYKFLSAVTSLLFFIFGNFYLISRMRKEGIKSIYSFFTVFTYLIMIGITGYLPLRWDRYYLPIVIMYLLVQVLGLKFICDTFSNFVKRYLNLSSNRYEYQVESV